MVLLTPAVTVIVHPIDTDTHPTVPTGWRWAIQVGGTPPGDLAHCANAGWCPTVAEARLEGEMVGVAVAKALHMVLGNAEFRTLELDHDPIPAGGDRLGLPVSRRN